jgi:hypothetical protein
MVNGSLLVGKHDPLAREKHEERPKRRKIAAFDFVSLSRLW